MCTWELAASALLSVYGAKMQSDAQNQAAENQQQAINSALEQQDQWSRKAEGKALENADQYNVQDRTKQLEQTKDDAGDSLAQSLIKSRDEIGTPEQASGKLSDSFTADRASKLADQFQQSVDMARLMGRVRGVQDMLGNEAVKNGDYATQLATIGRNAQGDYSAAQPGIAAAGKVNTGQVALGGLAQGLGSGYLSSNLGDLFGGSAGVDVGNGAGNANLMANGGLSKNVYLMGRG